MVKDIKYILKRVLIGLLIALALIYLKQGGLIGNVYAMEVKTYQTNNNQNYAGCTNCSVIDSAWNWSSGLTNTSGYLMGNIQVTSTITNVGYLSTLVKVMVSTDVGTYNCNIQGYGNNLTANVGTGSSTTQVSSYSITCPVKLGANGNFTHIYIQANGTTPDSISFYSPITFVYDKGQQDVINAIEDNTDAQNETNDLLGDNNVSNDTNTTLDSLLDKNGTTQSTFGPVADLILLPLTLFGAFYNSFGGTCSSYDLGSLLGHNIVLPCINLRNILGNGLYTTIDLAISLFLIYNIVMMCVHIFDRLTSLYDPFNDLFKPGGGK